METSTRDVLPIQSSFLVSQERQNEPDAPSSLDATTEPAKTSTGYMQLFADLLSIPVEEEPPPQTCGDLMEKMADDSKPSPQLTNRKQKTAPPPIKAKTFKPLTASKKDVPKGKPGMLKGGKAAGRGMVSCKYAS